MNLITRYRLWLHQRDVERRYWALPKDTRDELDRRLLATVETMRHMGISVEEAGRNITAALRSIDTSLDTD